MAQSTRGRKKGSPQRKKSSSRKSSGSSGRKSNKGYTDYAVGQEIRICVVLAVSVLLMLGNFGVGGRFGASMSRVLFGVFGIFAYAFPILLFFGYAFFVANRGNPLLLRKMLGLFLMTVFLCSFLQLLTEGYSRYTQIPDFYVIGSEDHTGGGFVGGIMIFLSGYVFGVIGAWIVTVFGLIISSIVLTQRPLLRSIGKSGAKAAGAARRRSRERSRARRKAREEYELQLRREEEAFGEDGQTILGRVTHTAKTQEPLFLDSREKADRKKASAKEEHSSGKKRKDTANAVPAAPALNSPAFSETQIKINGESFTMPSFLKQPEVSSAFPEEEPVAAAADPDLTWPSFKIIPEGSRETVSPEGPDKTAEDMEAAHTDESAGLSSEGSADAVPEKNAQPVKKKKTGAKEKQQEIASIAQEIQSAEQKKPVYKLPPVSLLTKGKSVKGDSRQHLMNTAAKLQQTLETFGVNVKVVNVSRGPTVTRYELQPEMGVKVSRIINLQDDIQLNLASADIRIEAPIPGKAAVGIEVPNKETAPVLLRDMLDSDDFRDTKAHLPFAVGKDLSGRNVIADIEKMPHLLIAGATGSGKSVCINTLIMSILYKCTPDQVKLLMIDPKVVELKIYDGIPHLLIPVVTDAKKAAGALNWAVQEMTERYNKFASYPGVRDIRSYNDKIRKINAESDEAEGIPEMPRIVVIVDELADLMMVSSSEVEDAICRLAQLARAAGIHIVIATQRPSVNVVTGLIKANMPSRIALAVSSGIDSRTILDMNGAEKLLGKGDMLFYPQGYPKPARVQGGYVSDDDIQKVVKFLVSQTENVEYNKEVEEQIAGSISSAGNFSEGAEDSRDEYFPDAGRLIIEKEKASIGMLQRAFKIGFNRAARIMDQLAEAGVVGGEEGTKPRKILMTMDEFEQILEQQ
ncbi:MAG: DNA translocase FtsK [Lachnospiraceae bacterium]|nr:DNA translocase FtsK [Lachnospiraceae bacterium]